jgi:eukaryotic-like serine/threonine-protein kinase
MKSTSDIQPISDCKDNLIGKQVGQYTLTRLIGKGGMGRVYCAHDTGLTRDVAVKILPVDNAQNNNLVERFIREANTSASLEHQNIISIYNVGIQDDLRYIVMRFVHGETLRDIINHSGALEPRRVLLIVRQLSEALDYAHSKGIIHRDIKPANIMLGVNDFVTLMDFGISKVLKEFRNNQTTLTSHDQLIGTPEYMAPEQFIGDPITACSDIYSLSVVIYEMLTGNVPFSGDTPFTISHGHIYEPPPSPRKINTRILPAVEQIVLNGLSKNPADRYQTASELYSDLSFAITGTATAHEKEKLKLVLSDGREQQLVAGTLRMGRTRENDIMINDNLVSRHHAEIKINAQGILIIDLGSTNGTFVNGQKLTPHIARQLTAGCEICLGAKSCLKIRRE